MAHYKKAHFVKNPAFLEDLLEPFIIIDMYEYEIVAKVTLSPIAYENFTTDLYADRQFIEDNFYLCSTREPYGCILVQQYGRRDGVLVVPRDVRYVKYAAYYNPEFAL